MSFLEEGELVGRYRVEALLAEGGMGRIYRALDTLLGRRVALKVISGEQAPDSPAVARLLREARAAAALSHPNVCSVFDVGESDGRPFIAMELVQGTSLRALIPRREVALDQRLRWIHDLATALAAAHRAHLVHRDIKPDNVMIAVDGRVRLLDFGIVHWAGDHGEAAALPGAASRFRTQDGAIVGTVGYMAPEQAAGGAIDARTDQFAWGVVAYETLSGRHPFGGGDAIGDPPPLSERVPDLPFGIAAIVTKALAAAPRERFADMDEIVALLQPAIGTAAPAPPPPVAPGSPEAATLDEGPTRPARVAPAPTATRARPPRAARRVWISAAIAGAALIIVAGAVRALRGARGAGLAVSNLRRLTFGDGCEEFPSVTPDGRAVIYDATDAGGTTALFRIELADGAQPRLLATGATGRTSNPSVSPAGDRLAFVQYGTAGSATMLAGIDGSAPRRFGDRGMFPRWSSDGRALWARRGGVVGLYDVASDAALRTLEVPAGMQVIWLLGGAAGPVLAQVIRARSATPSGLIEFGGDGRVAWQLREELEPALALAPGGRHALASRQRVAGEPELIAIPLDDGPVLSLASTGIAARDGLAVSRDGRTIVWSTCEPVVRVAAIDAAGHERIALPREGGEAITVAGIPGTGDLLVVSGRTGRAGLWRMDLDDRRPPQAIALGDRVPRDVAVSPDGSHFAVSIPDAGIAVGSLRGDPAVRMVTEHVGDANPSFRKAGDAIVFTRPEPGGSAQVMVVALSGGAPAVLLAADSHDAAVSPADDSLAYLTGPGDAPMRADARGGEARPLSPALAAARYRDLRFSPDGARVLVLRGDRELIEVDAATGAVLRTVNAQSRESIYAPGYATADGAVVPLAVRVRWQGNLYAADAEFGPPLR